MKKNLCLLPIIKFLFFVAGCSKEKTENTTTIPGGGDGTGGGGSTVSLASSTITTVDSWMTTASVSVNITNDGGGAITSKGVCWGPTQNPTISDPKTVEGTGIGSFTSNITGLALNAKYYVRAYATNSAGTAYSTAWSFSTRRLHEVGEWFGGGICFSVDATGEHGLIAAIQNIAPYAAWDNGTHIFIGTSTAIGSGQENTTKIINAQGPGNYAASICDKYEANGFTDWYLPSKDELNLFYQRRGGVVMSDGYWSSSEVDKDKAYAQTFGGSTVILQSDKSKNGGSGTYVLPIRSF